jgi:hypothetical protein
LSASNVSPSESSQVSRILRFLAQNPRQIIKIVVYSLLLLNFAQYVANDLNVARHTMHAGWKWHDWTAAFATTIDETAWFLLLLLFEVETYLLSDEAFTTRRVRLLQALRLVCVVFIAHTIIAAGNDLIELGRSSEIGETRLCDLAGQELSFARNLDYRDIDAQSCSEIVASMPLYQFDQGQLVTDADGLRVEWELAWMDLLDALLWVVILFFIEVMVRLQERDITSGFLLQSVRICKAVFYACLWLIAAYWAYRGHWVYAWDESLWILGFIAIDMNLSEWRDAIDEEAADIAINRSPGG